MDDLPNFIEIEYPQIGDRPARVGKLMVKYQWQPPQCNHCKVFGHSTIAYQVQPRTEAELAVKKNMDVKAGNVVGSDKSGNVKTDAEGFTIVGKKNKPVVSSVGEQRNKQQSNLNNRAFQNRNSQGFNRLSSNGNYRQNNRSGGSFQHGRFNNDRVQNSLKSYGANGGMNQMKKGVKSNNTKAAESANMPNVVPKKDGLVHKPPLISKYNANFKPKVLVRGSGFASNLNRIMSEDIPVSNSFHALSDQVMVDKEEMFINGAGEEYTNVVWPKLQKEVEEVMKSGVYPSAEVKSNWSLS